MIIKPDPNFYSSLKALSRAVSAAVVAIGALVLIGRWWGSTFLARVVPGWVSMHPTTAFTFVLSGVSLWLRQDQLADRTSRRIAVASGVAVTVLGIVMVSEHAFGWTLEIDPWWPQRLSDASGAALPTRIAPVTTLNVVLIGAVLLLFDTAPRYGYWLAQFQMVSAGLIALLALTDRLYVDTFPGWASALSIPDETALTFFLLSLGLLFARPDRVFTDLVATDCAGGMLLRRLLPLSLIGPLAVGWLLIQGERLGYYNAEFGFSFLIWFGGLLFVGVVFWSAGTVNRVDAERRGAEKRYAGILDITPEAIIAVDDSQRILLFNKGAEQIFGWQEKEVLGRPLDVLLPARVADAHRQNVRDFAAMPETARRMGDRREVLGRRKDGTEFPAEASISKLVEAERKTFTVILRDITERRRVEGRLQESESRFRQLADHIRDVFWVQQLDSNQFVYVSPAFEDIWGRTCQSLYDSARCWFDAIHPEDRAGAIETFGKQALGGYDQEFRVVRPDGSIRWVRDRAFPVKDDTGRVYRMAGIAEDITQHKAQLAALEYQGRHDSLTGLPNRVMLRERLRDTIASANALGRSVALLLLDLDRFKVINDTLGHHRGDLLLQQIGLRLKKILHEKDLVARLGGDEFAVVLPLAESLHAADVATKILKALEPPFEIEGLPIVTEASIGIAVFPDHGDSADLLMQRADVAMYRSKPTGGYLIYDPRYDHHSPRRLALLGELRHAIEHNELMLYYQPQVSFKSETVTGFEALVRWKHPYRGIIPPDQFIGPAEQTGLIKPLTFWVIQEAQRQAARWAESGIGLRLSVNLSARQMHDPELPNQFAELLRDSGCVPEGLELEITESAIMVDPERALQTIVELKALGLRFSIDDFGTGYSSLAYLKSLPVEIIKIDKSFVMNMGHNPNDMAIVRSTIEMAHNLGLKVVAEGIESESIWALLAAMGCDAGQGYFLSKPLAAEAITQWLRESPWSQNPTGSETKRRAVG